MSENDLTNAAPASGDYVEGDTENDLLVQQVSVGYQLRAAREARGVSIGEVAAALKLSPRQVDAIESDDWSHLPRIVIRGFVRNYARYLGQDVVSFLEILDRVPLPAVPELEVRTEYSVALSEERRSSRRDSIWVVSGLVILVLAVLTYFLMPIEWWQSGVDTLQNFIHAGKEDKPENITVQPIPIQTMDASSGSADTPSAIADQVTAPVAAAESQESQSGVTEELTRTGGEVSESHEQQPTTGPPPVVSGEAPLPPGQAKLFFSFTGSSWVEVRDRNGQAIFSQLGAAGSQREVSGQPPLSIVIGNASHVTLQYKGNPVDLSKRSKDGVVRLTLK